MYGVVNDYTEQSQNTRAVKLYGALLNNAFTNGKNSPISYSWGAGKKNKSYNLLTSGHYKDVKARIHATNGGNYKKIFPFAGDLKGFNVKNVYTFTPNDIKNMPNFTEVPPLHKLTYGEAIKRVKKAYPSLKRAFKNEKEKDNNHKARHLSKISRNLNMAKRITNQPKEIKNLQKAQETINNITKRITSNESKTNSRQQGKVQIHDFSRQKTYGDKHKVRPKSMSSSRTVNPSLRRHIGPRRN